MNKTALQEIIRNGENSGVEFKRDDVHPQNLAKELIFICKKLYYGEAL